MMMDERSKFLMEEAIMLHRHAIARHGRIILDSKSTMWIIRREAWIELVINASDVFPTIRNGGMYQGNELMGIPVRITVDDEPDVPMIQLVMEPEMGPR